jgi:hypothetical protein
MSEELKPCPFCGKTTELRHYQIKELMDFPGHPGFLSCEDCVDGVSVAKWNTRPLEDALCKQLDVAMRGLGEIQQRYKNGIGFGAGLVATSTLAEIDRLGCE